MVDMEMLCTIEYLFEDNRVKKQQKKDEEMCCFLIPANHGVVIFIAILPKQTQETLFLIWLDYTRDTLVMKQSAKKYETDTPLPFLFGTSPSGCFFQLLNKKKIIISVSGLFDINLPMTRNVWDSYKRLEPVQHLLHALTPAFSALILGRRGRMEKDQEEVAVADTRGGNPRLSPSP